MRSLASSITIFLLVITSASFAIASDVKDADLAGSWYPSGSDELSRLVDGYLQDAAPGKIDGRPFGIIVPHAGIKYSGPVAAFGYKAVVDPRITSVVLLAFSHRKQFDGVAIYDRGSFRTPLGEIAVDTDLAEAIASASPRISFLPEAFRDENSSEMELPFIQSAFRGAKIVPLIFGSTGFADAEAVASALEVVLRGRDDYIVIASTDLSHYRPYDEAKAVDGHLIGLLSAMKAQEIYDEASLGLSELCGVMPVTTILLAAKKLGFNGLTVVRYANSGDTSGDKRSVVGYVSAVIFSDEGSRGKVQGASSEGQGDDEGMRPDERKGGDMFTVAQKKRLLQIARESIVSYVTTGKRKSFSESDPLLDKEMGAFVTLHEDGELRGCIGNMVGKGPLYKTVADMAIEAATGDPRFPRLTAAEIDRVDIEISVLTPLRKVKSADEIKIPGQGVIVRKGFASGVYLPQVATETGWSKEEFLSSLCAHKAGLPADAWKDPATELLTFEAVVFGEKE